jgi:hypothetical protein
MNCVEFDKRPLGSLANPSSVNTFTFNAPSLELFDPDVVGRVSGLKIPDLYITFEELTQIVTFRLVARDTIVIEAEDNGHAVVAATTVVPGAPNTAQQAFVASVAVDIRRIRMTGPSNASYLFEVCAL